MCHVKVVVGGEEASFLAWNIFQRKLTFPSQLCMCLKFFQHAGERESLRCEDPHLSHECAPLLLETVFLFFLSRPIFSQSGETKHEETVCTPTILIPVWTPSVINCAGCCFPPCLPVNLIKNLNFSFSFYSFPPPLKCTSAVLFKPFNPDNSLKT